MTDFVEIEDQLEVLSELVKSGKVRFVGLSNETPWGVMKFLSVADRLNFPRVVSIQNPYSLLNRSYEVGLAEISMREKCGLLAYSPLAFGMLTGKYDNGKNLMELDLLFWRNVYKIHKTKRFKIF